MNGPAPRPGLEGLVGYLAALAGSAPAGQLLELRYRRSGGGMGQRFFDCRRPDATAAAIAVLGRRQDVYVGAAPRARREGTRDAIAAGWALWADCDGEAAAGALAAFDPAPAMLVRSGSAENRHGYWPLTAPLEPAPLEDANRRVAFALGADRACTDAARVLRPPGSMSFKHKPPVSVVLERFTGERFQTDELLARLPEIPPPAARPTPAEPALVEPGGDPLREVEPAVYVTVLTGQVPGRDRKVSCPFHRDRTPSLHAYETAADGFYCFGCGRGGSVYDLGAELLGLSTRGREFLELRARLYELLLPDREPPSAHASRPGATGPERTASRMGTS